METLEIGGLRHYETLQPRVPSTQHDSAREEEEDDDDKQSHRLMGSTTRVYVRECDFELQDGITATRRCCEDFLPPSAPI